MKADNEPAISLPVYFKSVKMENMFFDKKKKKKKRKKKRKIKFPTVGVGPRTFFFSRGGEVELEYQTMSTWTTNYNTQKGKGIKNELIKQRYVSLEWFTSLKSRPFILESVTAVNKLKPWKQ